MSRSKLNTPPPVIEPTTRATSGSNVSLFETSFWAEFTVLAATDEPSMTPFLGRI